MKAMKVLYDLKPGDVLCDLHDGVSVPTGLRVVSSAWIEHANPLAVVQALLPADSHYTNKHLVVVGFNALADKAMAVAAYDGCYFVVVTMENATKLSG